MIKSQTIAKVVMGTYTLTGAMNVNAKDLTKTYRQARIAVVRSVQAVLYRLMYS